MRDEFRTMLVPVGIAEQCRAMAGTWPGGQGMFVVPCSNGEEVTHYLSSGLIDGQIAQQMPWIDYDTGEPVPNEGDLVALVEAINAQNPEAGATVESVNSLLVLCDISTQSWQDACERLGLTLEVQ